MGAVLPVIMSEMAQTGNFTISFPFPQPVFSLLGVIIGSKQISYSLTITSYSPCGTELQGKYLNGKETDFICFNFISQKLFLKVWVRV